MHVIATLGSIIATNGKKEWNDELITCQSAVTRCWDEQGFSSDCSKMLIIFLLKIFVFEKHKQTTKIFFFTCTKKSFLWDTKTSWEEDDDEGGCVYSDKQCRRSKLLSHTHTHTQTRVRKVVRFEESWLVEIEMMFFEVCNVENCGFFFVQNVTEVTFEVVVLLKNKQSCAKKNKFEDVKFNTEKYQKIISPKIDSKVSFLLYSH